MQEGERLLPLSWEGCRGRNGPADRNYNRPVRLPYPASHEALYRDDALYDLLVVLSVEDQERLRQNMHHFVSDRGNLLHR